MLWKGLFPPPLDLPELYWCWWNDDSPACARTPPRRAVHDLRKRPGRRYVHALLLLHRPESGPGLRLAATEGEPVEGVGDCKHAHRIRVEADAATDGQLARELGEEVVEVRERCAEGGQGARRGVRQGLVVRGRGVVREELGCQAWRGCGQLVEVQGEILWRCNQCQPYCLRLLWLPERLGPGVWQHSILRPAHSEVHRYDEEEERAMG